MKQKSIALLLSLCLIISLAACGGGQSSTATPAPVNTSAPAEASGTGTVSFTDSVGRTVEVPAGISRIAPTGPLAQTVLFALAPDLFVGISTEWDETAAQYLPTEYYNLPVLGQLYGGKGEMNLEELAAADPQVIIDVGEPKDSIVEDLDGLTEQVDIPFVHITATIATMGGAYRQLGQLLGRGEEAEKLASYCDETYAMIQGVMDRVGGSKAKVLYCLGDTGTNVIAKGSYHAEVIDLLADNLAVVAEPSSKGSGNEVDMEQLLLWDPDIIIFAPDSIYDTVAEDPAWSEMTAIRNGAYCEVPFGPHNWMGFPPSVQRFLGMLWLADQLYPEQTDYDLYTEVAEYYDLFYHCELTQEQFDALTANGLDAAK